MKQNQLFHISPADAQKFSYDDYERDITYLRQQIARCSDELDRMQQEHLKAQDQFETNLEKAAYFTAILQIQYRMLCSCLAASDPSFAAKSTRLDLAFLADSINGGVNNKVNEHFQSLKQRVREAISLAKRRCDELGLDEESSADGSLRSKEFVSNIEQSRMMIKQIADLDGLDLPGVLSTLQQTVLQLLRDNQPLRQQKAGVVNQLARANAAAVSKQVSDEQVGLRALQQELQELQVKKSALSSRKLLEEVRNMRAELCAAGEAGEAGGLENEAELEMPDYIRQIAEFRFPDEQQIAFPESFSAWEQQLGEIASFSLCQADVRAFQERQTQFDMERLRGFNAAAERAFEQYYTIYQVLQRGITDPDAACDALDAAEQFKPPAQLVLEAQENCLQPAVLEINDAQSTAESLNDTLRLARAELETLLGQLQQAQEAGISAYIQQIAANAKKLAAALLQLGRAFETNISSARAAVSAAGAADLQLRSLLFRIAAVDTDAALIYLQVRRNFCQICKTQPVRAMLPCGHLFCGKCIRNRPGRKQFCPKCTNSYQESQIVQLSKELIV